MTKFKSPQEALRYHVTGAIERGEAQAIVGKPARQRAFHNIEKSGFHRGQYVGYAGGAVYRIKKVAGGRWMAVNQAGGDSFTRDTLAEISKALDVTAYAYEAAGGCPVEKCGIV